MTIGTNEFIIAIVIALLLAGTLAYLIFKQRQEIKKGEKKAALEGPADPIGTRQLQLQAYERLILLTDRIALPNLISRVNTPGLSGREMQALLTHSIRQ